MTTEHALDYNVDVLCTKCLSYMMIQLTWGVGQEPPPCLLREHSVGDIRTHSACTVSCEETLGTKHGGVGGTQVAGRTGGQEGR